MSCPYVTFSLNVYVFMYAACVHVLYVLYASYVTSLTQLHSWSLVQNSVSFQDTNYLFPKKFRLRRWQSHFLYSQVHCNLLALLHSIYKMEIRGAGSGRKKRKSSTENFDFKGRFFKKNPGGSCPPGPPASGGCQGVKTPSRRGPRGARASRFFWKIDL